MGYFTTLTITMPPLLDPCTTQELPGGESGGAKVSVSVCMCVRVCAYVCVSVDAQDREITKLLQTSKSGKLIRHMYTMR